MKLFRHPSHVILLLLFLLALGLYAVSVHGAPAPGDRSDELFSAIVRIKTRVLADARTSATLGTEREGNGIIIDGANHVLTVGYILIEADAVEVTAADGKTAPARVVGYDHATGFGLLQTTVPLAAKPLALGKSADVNESDPVLVAPFGGPNEARLAFVTSRREFAGGWEYLIESAIFTTPPILDWAGSALIDHDGKLVGVGSLLVRNTTKAAEGERALPGNMFIPIDLLKPILADLIATGRAGGAARPWLGLATEEVQGHLLVTRVSPEGPADKAGIRNGDIVVGIGSQAVTSHGDFYRKVWSLGSAGVDVSLKVLQGADLREVKLRSIDRVEYFRVKPTY